MTLTAEGMPTSFPADCPDQLMATLHAVQSTSMKADAKDVITDVSGCIRNARHLVF
jgi:hypothetical protein